MSGPTQILELLSRINSMPPGPAPNHCPGALLREEQGRPRRIHCNGEVEVVHRVERITNPDGELIERAYTVKNGLCASCSAQEREFRNMLRAKAALGEGTHGRVGRW